MKILLINAVCGTGSTGRICTDIAKQFDKEGHEVKIAYGRHADVPKEFLKYAIRIGNDFDVKIHALITRILDEHGFGSKRVTKEFLEWVERFKPDLIWLHNIHGYYLNIEMLFSWIKKHPNIQVKWTLHDCWAFTGHCTHFSLVKCKKWKKHCFNCIQKKEYPASYWVDNCYRNFARKKEVFTGVNNMKLITPSQWLANLVKESFLKEYPIDVEYNKIDTNIFKPSPNNFREKYGLENKKIILGVANVWDYRKGLNDFIELNNMLDSNYVIVLVGVSEKQIKDLPRKILGIKRTSSPKELAEIYTAADVFVNTSKEETFGMTSIEALACGTKAIVYQDTACEEVIEGLDGIAIPSDINILYKTIINLVD